MASGNQPSQGIISPHDHDVLSGRGNFVNYHAGNEHFRALVRKHKLDYVKCPKPQKGKFSRMIVDEIKARNPPGRFLRQDTQTKLWYDIGDKKALDKTRQALREGAPELMKELSGESGDDSDGEDNPRAVQKDALDALNRGAAGGNNFAGDVPMHPFMSHGGLNSPAITRNHLLTSPQLTSPQLMSPGMLLGQMSPDMGAFAGRGDALRSRLSSAIPPPQVHQQGFDQMATQLNAQQQAMLLNQGMNTAPGMGSNLSGNQPVGMGGGMMSPQQVNQQLQNQINAQQAAMNQMSQQLQQQQRQHFKNQNNLAEMQMLQSKMQNIHSQSVYPNNNFDPAQVPSMPPPPPPPNQSETPRQRNTSSDNQASQKVEVLPGNNPRRMPPTSLLKRDDSLKMDKLFTATSPASVKKKYDGNGSSAHLSAMSLSIGDMNEDGNLSSVFDSSLRISGEKGGDPQASKEKLKDRSSNVNWDSNALDMSVTTLGASDMRLPESGNLSSATFGDAKVGEESEGNMSFSKVFEDPDKMG